jgi:hypothetical protein
MLQEQTEERIIGEEEEERKLAEEEEERKRIGMLLNNFLLKLPK